MAAYSCRSDTSSNTNYYVDYTATRVNNTTTYNFTIKFILGSATGLGTGNSRDAKIYFDNSLIKTVEVKGRYDNWSYGTTHSATFSAAVTTTNTVASTKNCKIQIVVGTYTTGVPSCLWTTYPVNFSVTAPASPNVAPTAVTTFTASPSIALPGETVTLTWSGATDANLAKYKIQYSVSPYASWVDLVTTNSVSGAGSITDTATTTRGASKKWQIQYIDALGQAGPWKSVTTPVYTKKKPTPPTAPVPSVTTIEPGEMINLTFGKSIFDQAELVYYEVAMKDTSGNWYNSAKILSSGKTTTLGVTTAGWTRERSWVFLVRSLDTEGEYSDWSSPSIAVTVAAAALEPIIVITEGINPQEAPENNFDIVKTTRIINQLKQVDLYRAKYLDSDKVGALQNAWCFNGAEKQGWTSVQQSGVSLISDSAKALSTNYYILKTGLSLSTATYPYLSTKYTMLNATFTAAASVTGSTVDLAPVATNLSRLGITSIDTTTDNNYILIGTYRFCQKKNYVATYGYQLTLAEYSSSLKKYIAYAKEMYPVRFTIRVKDTNAVYYTVSNLAHNRYGYFVINLNALTTGKTITEIRIMATWNTSFPFTDATIRRFQFNFDYVKLDSVNVFADSPIQWNLISITEDNAMRSAVETVLKINSSTAIWSSGSSRVEAYHDIVSADYLTNFPQYAKTMVDKCRECDLFTCACYATSYGGLSCSACHSRAGLGADAGIACSQCYTTTYSYQVCTCYSPMNALDTRCKCGYATNPMCNTYTCWCNSGTKYTW